MPDVLTLYIKLIASFLADKITLEEFEESYFKLFKSDDSFGPTEENRTLSEIFSALDCIDEEQGPYKVTEAQLRQGCAAAIKTLQSLNAGRYKSYENKVETMPEHLQNAYKMLGCAFPKGIPRTLYRPLIALLSASFEDSDLVHLISHYTGMQEGNVHGDVEDVEFARGSNTLSLIKDLDEKMNEVRKILLLCGYRP